MPVDIRRTRAGREGRAVESASPPGGRSRPSPEREATAQPQMLPGNPSPPPPHTHIQVIIASCLAPRSPFLGQAMVPCQNAVLAQSAVKHRGQGRVSWYIKIEFRNGCLCCETADCPQLFRQHCHGGGLEGVPAGDAGLPGGRGGGACQPGGGTAA